MGAGHPLEERRRQLEEEIPRLQGEIDFLKIQHLSQESILTDVQDLYSRWFDLSFEERRGIVEAIVERITVGKGEIEITLTYEPSAPPPLPPLKMLSRDARNPGLWRRGSRRWKALHAGHCRSAAIDHLEARAVGIEPENG